MALAIRYYLQCDEPGCSGKASFNHDLTPGEPPSLPPGWTWSTGDAETDEDPERLRVRCALHSRPKPKKPDSATPEAMKKKPSKKASGDAPAR